MGLARFSRIWLGWAGALLGPVWRVLSRGPGTPKLALNMAWGTAPLARLPIPAGAYIGHVPGFALWGRALSGGLVGEPPGAWVGAYLGSLIGPWALAMAY